MLEKLNKVRKEHENFDRQLVDNFAKVMPKLLDILIEGYLYDCHIGSKDTALLAEDYIKNSKGEKVGFHFGYDEVLNYFKQRINLNEAEFYPADIWTWSNVKYFDLEDSLKGLDDNLKEKIVLDYTLSELLDTDFPFYSASSRPYYWLKAHIEKAERQI